MKLYPSYIQKPAAGWRSEIGEHGNAEAINRHDFLIGSNENLAEERVCKKIFKNTGRSYSTGPNRLLSFRLRSLNIPKSISLTAAEGTEASNCTMSIIFVRPSGSVLNA